MSARRVSDSTSRATSAPSGGSTVISDSENISEILLHRYKLFISKNILSFVTLLGIFLGCILGFTFKYSPLFGEDYWTPRRLSYVYLPGELFLNALSCLYAPTLISSLMAAVGSLGSRAFKFVLWRSFIYIWVSTVAASALGVLTLLILNPGSPKDHPLHSICFETFSPPNGNTTYLESYCTKDGHPCHEIHYDPTHMWSQQTELKKRPPPTGNISYCSDTYLFAYCRIFEDSVMDVIRGYIPSNIIDMFLSTKWTIPDLSSPVDTSDPNAMAFEGWDTCSQYTKFQFPSNLNLSKPSLWDYNTETAPIPGLNLNGIFTFFIVVALALLAKSESGIPTLNFVTSLSECTLKMGTWIVWLSPIFVTSLVAGHILEEASIFDFPSTVYHYLITCVLALILYTLVVLPVVYYAFLRKSPFKFYKQLLPVVLIKLGTPSRSSTFPITIEFLETVCNLDPRIVRLVVPFGSEINLPGTAMCTVIAVGYISQLHGINLDFSMYLWLMIRVFMAITFTPSGDSHIQNSFFTRRMKFALASVGLPKEFRLYVASIEWIVDELAAVTNTLADCVACAVIHHLSVSSLETIGEVIVKSSGRQKHKNSETSSGGKKSNSGPTVPVPVTTTSRETSKAVDDTTATQSESTTPKTKTIQQQRNLSNDSAHKKRRMKSKSSSLAKSGSPSRSMKSKYSKKSETDGEIGGGGGASASKAKQNRKKMSSLNSRKDGNISAKSTPANSRKSSKELIFASKKSKRSRTTSKSKSKSSELLPTSRSRSESKPKLKSKSKSKGSTN